MRLVVIGGVAAGLSAAARARRLDPRMEIVVLERGEVISYGACGFPYYAQGQARHWSELVVYSASEFSRERDIDVRTGTEVVAIEHPRRQVRLAGGETVAYDKLVIATGARARRDRIAGLDQPHIFGLNTLPEAIRLRARLDETRPGRALVLGGGYLGLEAVETLRHRGWKTTLAHAGECLLGRWDGWLTSILVQHLERCRVEVRVGERLTAVPPGWDLVVPAVGLRPNVELAQSAGIELGRTGAIRVTDRMETNLHGVFAAGDCAETNHMVTGRPVWIPLGTTANKMGRVAGASAAGARERFPGVVGTSIVRVCGLGVAVTGLSEAMARREGFDPVAARIEARDRPRYFRGRPCDVELVADRRTGRLLGGVVAGDFGVAGRINVVATTLAQRMLVEDFQHLDLAYAPPFAPVWDPLLIAAQQLIKLLH